MKHQVLLAPLLLCLAAIACGGPAILDQPAEIPETVESVFDTQHTAFGFFPTPPQVSMESFIDHLRHIGEHADIILFQQAVPWADFIDNPDGDSRSITDIHNNLDLAEQNGLEAVFVVDPLNGLNRTEFAGLPPELEAGNFSTPGIRSAIKNFALRIIREFQPRYLGLASEINTYADAYPQDFVNFVSLYREIYIAVKSESPTTKVFVTFQWEDLNNLGVFNDGEPYQIKWELIEVFEPQLDLWVISTYPFVVFNQASDIPIDYYTPLLERTSKPLAVAEGGYISVNAGNFKGTDQDQVNYLDAIHDQIGDRLVFWIYLLLSDFDIDSFARILHEQGNDEDIGTLSLFASVGLQHEDGTLKPALEAWDRIREENK